MNPFQNIRCHSYPKQWPPLGDEKLWKINVATTISLEIRDISVFNPVFGPPFTPLNPAF
jgi:hypothetical protein